MANGATLKERMARVEQKLEDLTKKVEDGFSSIQAQLSGLDKKYAPKWVEWFAKGIIYLGAGGVVSLFFFLVKYLMER